MNQNIEEKINVLTNFFDITTEQEDSLSCIREYFDSSYYGFSMNHVLSKRQALELVAEQYKHANASAFSSFMISSDAVKEKEIVDFCGQKIFHEIEPWISGWLFFYDSCTLMNWEHPCEYIFVSSKETIFKCKHNRAPGENLILRAVEQ